ncbi:MAG: TonB-dependent siderophore receptor [Methylococcales bacterium]
MPRFKYLRRSLFFIIATGCMTGLPSLTRPAAAETLLHLSIPAQSLDGALIALGDASGLQLSYPGALSKGLRTRALSGDYTPDEALDKLLADTGLTHLQVAANTVTIQPEQKAVSSEPRSATLGKVTVTGQASQSSYNPNDPYDENYAVPRSSTATKTDTSVMETPVSIQVIPRSVIQDQKTPSVKDALENVSGVRPQPSLGRGSGFIIRGFPNNSRIYRNGLGVIGGFGGSIGSGLDTANLESIEVLKGPGSVLYGRLEPGGLININTKMPLGEPYYALEQQFASYDFYRTLWDAAGPITQDRSLLYRLSGAYQRNNSFRDFVSSDRYVINPSITWRPTEAIDFNVNLQVSNQDYKADFGLPVIGNRPAPIPISRSLDDPNTPLSNTSEVFLGTDFIYRFNDSWALHNRFLAYYSHQDSTFVNPVPAFGNALRADNRTLDRNIFTQFGDTNSYVTNLDLTGKLDLWGTKHEVLAGFDFTQGLTTYAFKGDYNNPNPALVIDIFNPGPSYGIPRSVFDTTLATTPGFPNPASLAKTQWYGAYFQDHITLWDRLHILGGGRYDWAEQGRGRGPTFDAAENALPSTIRKDDHFSPRVGILYQALNWFSVYGNWSNSFGANNGLSATGRPQPPELSEQYEVGFKTQLFDQRLTGNLAFYTLTKQNVLTPDLSTPDPRDSIAIGTARSRGIELDVSGQITDHISIVGSYAFTDARVTQEARSAPPLMLNAVTHSRTRA